MTAGAVGVSTLLEASLTIERDEYEVAPDPSDPYYATSRLGRPRYKVEIKGYVDGQVRLIEGELIGGVMTVRAATSDEVKLAQRLRDARADPR